jgi:hypothetical protein
MEKVKQESKQTRRSKTHWRIGERLCEGLKLQQLGNSNTHLGIVDFSMFEYPNNNPLLILSGP